MSQSQPRLLWADDDEDVAATLSAHLKPLDVQIRLVKDGHEALDEIRTHGPWDLLIVDLQMPPGQWGGLWLLKELETLAHSPPILVLSGEGAQQETIRAQRLGAGDYVTKEDAPDELARQVEAMLANDLERLLSSEEGSTLEFKETLRWDVRQARVDKDLERGCLKTIAAFLNSEGGTLIIGRSDDGRTPGLERDFASLRRQDLDGFEQHLRQLLHAEFGPAVLRLIDTRYRDARPGAAVAVVRVSAATAPVYLGKAKEFYVRSGNLSRPLTVHEAVEYALSRWR